MSKETLTEEERIIEAERLFLEEGLSQSEIAEKFGLSRKTINRWSVNGEWLAKKEGISTGKVKQLPISKRIESRVEQGIAKQLPLRIDAIATLVDLILDLKESIANNDDWKAKAGCASAIAKLLQLYLDITPTTAQQYARLAAKDGITPEDFINALREEWGRTA